MLTKEENEALTRGGPGTRMGELLRRYWQPVALAEELPEAGSPKHVKIMDEELVLFRDESGRVGLLGIHCSHRAADLSYGRIEDGGLRCLYHGWLYDVHGRCLEQPGEPPGSRFHEKIQHLAYRCQERGGVIFAYLGRGEPPELPSYEYMTVPEDYRVATKVLVESNFLQGNEGNIDPVHLSFLHRMVVPGDANQTLNRTVVSPYLETEETDYGLRIYAVRKLDEERNYVRVTNFIMPNLCAVAGDAEGYIINWHVPIDDTHHWRFMLRFNRYSPVDRSKAMGRSNEVTPDYRLVRNKTNRYLQDRESMETSSYIGLGREFLVHDAWANEGEGPIQDRTEEHLGYTDKALTAARRLLLRAVRDVQEGSEPLHVLRDPERANEVSDIYARNDIILPASVDWHQFWKREEAMELAVSTRTG